MAYGRGAVNCWNTCPSGFLGCSASVQNTFAALWSAGFQSRFPEYQGHLPVGKRPLPALGAGHDVAYSYYDRKSACHIPFDHHIPVPGVPALGDKDDGAVR